ncbi:MAG TPA: hypothetical protein VMI72_10570 [Roseiarcus sp.]|nr:hypothetical protein [Roseiarcus sp.]
MTTQRPLASPPASSPWLAGAEKQGISPAVFDSLAKAPFWLGVLMSCALVETALQTYAPSIVGMTSWSAAIVSLAIAPVAVGATFDAASRPWRFPRIAPTAPLWLAGGLCILVGWLAGTFWPNSGDEHSYVFLADTLLGGRLTNRPAPDPKLFALFRVFTMRGQTFSQYLPGWPLVLAPFRFAGVEWLANPLLTGLLGWCLLRAMRCLRVAPAVQPVTLLMVLMSPFALFNGASLFSSTLSATLAAAIVWQQLLDEQQPSAGRKALIGALFGGELLTRPEVFLVLAALYAGDRLWNRCAAAFRDAAPMLLGALPLIAFFFSYNWTVTGNPFETPVSLTNPDVTLEEAIADRWVMAVRAAEHLAYWAGSLGQFGGLALLVLQAPALARKMRRGSLRFFDLAPPAMIAFFLFFPHDGGHQYGPRYWFPAWPLAALTVATGLLEPDGAFRLGRMRFSFDRLTAANLAFCAAVLPGLIVTTRVYIDARREVLADAAPVKPAVVLVPSRQLTLWPWQGVRLDADSLDFARGDVNFSGPVLYGRLDAPDAVARACRLPGRTVYVWRGPGNLVRSDCSGGAQ